ncbi:NIPSNAP family protein [Alloacidobacterium dinghuense]|uniref:NIPSNAP family protein n=1 Tax=Alloacidobacterium dinghuense TaxID=2763107 RepID=A0A7G8BI09_9BACT|nr:NIPSNAP family protein [Alloacidobacterium dinghuense]QNI32179.1 NIPSNAP family protein [Alloacidobacterium dinghuense]
MERRRFLTSSLAASTLAFAGKSVAQESTGKQREYYELRKYFMQSGQTKLTENYVSGALIPALNRMGMSPVGAFNLTLGPETPTLYVLIPSTSVEALVTADLKLAQDKGFMQAAEPFWNASAKELPYVRIESSLMIAFEGWPKVTVPAATAQHAKRVFQLRTYESPTNQDHVRKVEMFHNGEFEIFQKAGFGQVFYGDSLIGPRLPNLTYMLTFGDIGEMNGKWAAFGSDPDWKKLSASPRYAFESIVSNITNLILTPTEFSQI